MGGANNFVFEVDQEVLEPFEGFDIGDDPDINNGSKGWGTR